VKDTCQGFIELAENEKVIGKTINIGLGEDISVKDLVELIKKLMNSDIEILEDTNRIRPAKSEVFRLLSDIKLITSLTNYKTNYNLEKGLTETIEWFLNPENLKKYKTNLYNV
jgi:nucleoside-diphosphate-sugar epimerase